MRIPDLDPALLADAKAGRLAAVEGIVAAIQPGVFNLAVRMLGHREDAQDASQEILVKVVTHLGSFRGEAAFSTWVWRIARNHLATAATRARESPEVSLDEMEERLGRGLAFETGGPAALTPADKAEARELAVRCTQGMLLRLDRGHRLAYLLDTFLGLPSEEAAAVLEIEPAAYRKRLSRARQELHRFAERNCGWANPAAPCRCERQLPAVRATGSDGALPLQAGELAEAEARFDQLARLGDAAAVFRAHPAYRPPAEMRAAIRAVLEHSAA